MSAAKRTRVEAEGGEGAGASTPAAAAAAAASSSNSSGTGTGAGAADGAASERTGHFVRMVKFTAKSPDDAHKFASTYCHVVAAMRAQDGCVSAVLFLPACAEDVAACPSDLSAPRPRTDQCL